MTANVEKITRNLVSNLFDIAVDVQMAEPVATFYLWKLLNMVPKEKAQKLMENLPGITEKSMQVALEICNAKN